jgi:hypothetical protein
MLFRLQTWLAHHFRGVQYPRQQFIARGEGDAPAYGRRIFRTQMPWPQRIVIGVASLVAFALLLAAAVVLLFGVYLLATSY